MRDLFLSLLNSSITASWLILAILVLRPLLAHTPRKLVCILWALVAIRLICPVTIESAFSMVPSGEPVKQETFYQVTDVVFDAFPNANEEVNQENLSELQKLNFDIQSDTRTATLTDPLTISAIVWGIGMIGMVAYTIIGCILMDRRLAASICIQSNIYSCDYIDGPFIFGFFRPKMYLPSNLREEEIPYVLAHEEAHIKRKDYLWKPIGFLLLAIHWFNPIMWIAYKVFCRDIELACDEQVIQNLDHFGKAAYSRTLLRYSGPGVLAVGPLAFGEKDAKHRIKSVLSYKKPTVWITGIGVLAIVIAATCFLTNPVDNKGIDIETNLVQEANAENDIAQNNITENSIASSSSQNFLFVGQNVPLSDDTVSADSIILVTVNKEKQKLSLTAFPGNTYFELGTFRADNGAHIVGKQPLKLAYTLGYNWGNNSGAFSFLKQNIVEKYGINIDGCFAISPDVFIAVTDALSGVDVELDENEVNHMIAQGCFTKDEKAGVAHLDGKTALAYKYLILPGEYEGINVTRQLTITRLILEKIQMLSDEQLTQLMTTLLPLVKADIDETQTNVYVAEMIPLITSFSIDTHQCPDENTGENTAVKIYGTETSVLLPNFEKCRQMLNRIILG